MDSGILYWFLRRTKERVMNNIAFNGSTTFAQSNDIVAKTAYNGTVSGNVTIGGDIDGRYINFVGAGSGAIAGTNIPIGHTVPFTITLFFKSGSDVTSTQRILLNSISGTNRIGINIASGKIVVGMYDGGFIQKRNYSIIANTMYKIVYTFDGVNSSLVVNNIVATSTTNNPETSGAIVYTIGGTTGQFFTGYIYLIRIYSTALTTEQRTTELALGQKQTARKDCVLEILPQYFAGTTSLPTTIYDVKAFTPATPVVIVSTFSLGADAVDTDTSQVICVCPYVFIQSRTSSNVLTIRYDNAAGRTSTYTLGNGNRSTHTIVGTYAPVNGGVITSLFIDGTKVDTDTHTSIATVKRLDYIALGKRVSTFFNGTILNTQVYVGTITDAEGVSMSIGNPVTPANATLLAYPRRLPPYNNTMTDVSGNGYNFTLTP